MPGYALFVVPLELEMLHQVKDLSAEQRRAVESLLGRPVAEDESVSVKGIRSAEITPPRLSPEDRVKAAAKLLNLFEAIDQRRRPVSDSEEVAIINEALRAARPGYRPRN